jgi:DNA repair exonuclease SbcCD ATPase subunit
VAKGYQVGIASETKAFKQGIESGVIDPLEDAQKELDALGKSRGPEQLESDLKAAQTATKNLEKDTAKVADAIEQDYKRAYREAKESADTGLDGMKTKGAEVGSELRQNLGETFASFRGDLEDLPQIAQDTLGGLAGSGALGGIAGLAATAAGAAGLGLVTAAIQQQAEDAEKLRERLSAAYSEAAAEGRTYLTTAQIVAEAQSLMFDPERAGEWKALQEDAKTLGMDVQDVVAAYTGDLEKQETVQARINSLMSDPDSYYTTQRDGIEELKPGMRDLEGRWDNLREVTEENQHAAEEFARFQSRALTNMINDTEGVTKEVDALGNELFTLPDGKQIMIDADTGLATENIDDFQGDLNGLPEEVTTTVTAEANLAGVDSQIRNYRPPRIKINGDVVFSNGRSALIG